MRRIAKFFTIVICVFAFKANAEIVVVANVESDTPMLSRNELVDLYMGRFRTLPNKKPVALFDHNDGSAMRESFYRQLIDKSEAQVNAFWARLLFTGRAKPPEKLDNAIKVVEAVTNDNQAIGYINASELDGSVKVIFRFE